MLDHKEVKKQIKREDRDKWLDERLKGIGRKSGLKAADIRRAVEEPKQSRWREDREERQAKTHAFLHSLSDAQRQAMWQTLFPNLAVHIERGWQLMSERPYQAGYLRKSFRTPSSPKMTAHTQTQYFFALCDNLAGLDASAEWFATYASYIEHYYSSWASGWLLAAILRGGGTEADTVRAILHDTINGEHKIAQMGQHCIVALLNSDDQADWEVVGKLLLAAQRQEGLRQSILETIDESHPSAFRYMLGLILEHDLVRFSATVRAFDTWFGFQWAGGSTKPVKEGIKTLIEFLDDEAARLHTIDVGEPEETYLALWATAYRDADEALKHAEKLQADPSAERRYVAARLAAQTNLLPESAKVLAHPIFKGQKEDSRLHALAIEYLTHVESEFHPEGLFDATVKLFEVTPKKMEKFKPIVWPWEVNSLERREVGNLLASIGAQEPERLIPYVEDMEAHVCCRVIFQLCGFGERNVWDVLHGSEKKKHKPTIKLSPDARTLMLQLIGDTRQDVHKAAFLALGDKPPQDDEIERLLGLLHRTTASLRKGIIERLVCLPAKRILNVADTLLNEGQVKKRAAGLELTAHLIDSNKSADQARELIQVHREQLDDPELAEIANRLTGAESEHVSYDDCLGLVPPGSLTPLPKPKYVGTTLETKAAKRCLRELAAEFLKHAETEVEIKGRTETRRALLGSTWLPHFNPAKKEQTPLEQAKEVLPLCDTWLSWLEINSERLRASEGLEWVRAWALTKRGDSYKKLLPAEFENESSYRFYSSFETIVEWMMLLSPAQGGAEFLIQHFEDSLAKSKPTKNELEDMEVQYHDDVSKRHEAERESLVSIYLHIRPIETSKEITIRLSLLQMHACFEAKIKGCTGPSIESLVTTFEEKVINEYDYLRALLMPRESGSYYNDVMVFGPIDEVSRLKPPAELADCPELISANVQMRNRLIEIESARGETTSVATRAAVQLRHTGGIDTLFKFVVALGRDKLVRQQEYYSWYRDDGPTRPSSFSSIIARTSPHDEDTLEHFVEVYQASGIKPAKLLEVVMFAPQWATHVEHALDMPGLEDAVWWIHAHTKQNDYWREQELRELWAARINERTALEAEDLEEGAVDVSWFSRVLESISEEGWDALQKPAKYASNSGGHKRAELFANAMLNRVETGPLLKRIDDKRHQDSVRALGVIPLPKDATKAKAELLKRYKRLQEFKRESRKFGSQRQASEGRAVEIGMQNLARTAGYRDPRRLQWAMESEAVADLAKGPVSVEEQGTTVTLAIDEAGAPELTVINAKGKQLKDVPAKLRKQPEISELRSRVTELRRQSSRMRISLEDSMCRGDSFTAAELREFWAHPMLRPMVSRLVFIGNGDLIGYLDKQGRVLRTFDGSAEPIGKKDEVRLAHPVDFLQRKNWTHWQHECFEVERVQPFKQIFRETYPKTTVELEKSDFSRRYAGHQVNPRQALALLKQRQWLSVPEEGVRKTFHDEGLIAEVTFQEAFYTPADIEGLTLEGISFIKRAKGRYDVVSLVDVPDRLFSEVMRDMDLVVSVAHAGSVDPEASASTIEMRTTLLRETCQLLNLTNVTIDGHHIKIEGELGRYSVHLGSAMTHVMPGRALIIVAVHSQYRGRLFLPFADEDPKTAEVLSKTLLLARDQEIKDPSILEQIRR